VSASGNNEVVFRVIAKSLYRRRETFIRFLDEMHIVHTRLVTVVKVHRVLKILSWFNKSGWCMSHCSFL
jgi:hypothetical protein